jgi:hypothetical protein
VVTPIKYIFAAAFHPLLIGNDANIAIMDRYYRRVSNLILTIIYIVKCVVPTHYAPGFLGAVT